MTNSIGSRIPSKLGEIFVTGSGNFVDDMAFPGMLHARFVRCPHPHAKIVSIDTSHALSIPGVELVWTWKDLSPYLTSNHFGHDVLDEEPLATDRARYVGDEVAIVLAQDAHTALEASEAVSITYDLLPAVTSVEDALSSTSPLLHPRLDEDPSSSVKGNLLHSFSIRTGDIPTALKSPHVSVSGSFKTNRTSPSALEPHGVIASYTPGRELAIHSPNQKPHSMVTNLETIFGFEPGFVTWNVPDIGGSFGTKAELLSHEICAAALTLATRKPVKIILDRLEELQTGRGRPEEHFNACLTADKNGNFISLTVEMIQNTGAYASYGIHTSETPGLLAACPYLIEHQHISGKVVYTNVVPSGAVRGFGDSQYTFVREQLVDAISRKLNRDPIDLRLQNIATKDQMPITTATGIKWRNTDLPSCITAVRDSLLPPPTPPSNNKLRGMGIAVSVKRNGKKGANSDFSKATVEVNNKGTVYIYSDVISVGQGTETGLAQITSEILGISQKRIKVITGNTDTIADGHGVGADRGTVFIGSATAKAAENLREKIIKIASNFLQIEPKHVTLSSDRIFDASNPDNGMEFTEFARRARFDDPSTKLNQNETGVSLIGHATFESLEAQTVDPKTRLGNVSHTYTHSAVGVIVDVDLGTGDIDILDICVAEDLGCVINPLLVEGQIQGCIGHAAGDVFLENFTYDSHGHPHNGTLVDYHLPTTIDVPLLTKMHKIESPDPATSHGQRGAGEGALLPFPAAIANAIHDATGVRFRELPLSPQKILPSLIDHGFSTHKKS
ncbi:MAG: xanthine dehydrogenase family protein molybdopterin-binding subunit [Halobacteriales archaeon]